MLKVSVPFDVELSFSDYKKDLYRQGELPISSQRSVPQTAEIVYQVFLKAEDELEHQRFDSALILFSRCLFFLENVIVPRKNELSASFSLKWDDMKKIFKRCLDEVERLVSNELVQLHQQLMATVKAQRAERERIIALQMEVDEPAGPTEEELEHERRRQQLLERESKAIPSVPPPTAPKTTSTVPLHEMGADSHSLKQQLLIDNEASTLESLRKELLGASTDPRETTGKQLPSTPPIQPPAQPTPTRENESATLEALRRELQGASADPRQLPKPEVAGNVRIPENPTTPTPPLKPNVDISPVHPTPAQSTPTQRPPVPQMVQQATPGAPIQQTRTALSNETTTTPKRVDPQTPPLQSVPPRSPAPVKQPPATQLPKPTPVDLKVKNFTQPSRDLVAYRTQLWGLGSAGQPGLLKNRRGLVNLGNTCYLNSVLQCFSATPVGKYFRADQWLDSVVDRYTGGGKVAEGFTYVMRELVVDASYAVTPSSLKGALGKLNESFAGQSQQDANELLQTLVDGIHEDVNINSKNRPPHKEINDAGFPDEELAHRFWAQYLARNRSVMVDLMAFQERSLVVCPSCGHATRSFSPLMSVQVPIPLLNRPVSIEDCLAAYCAPEVLDAQSLYQCEKCKSKVRATKQLSFVGAPTVLVVTLKRFKSYGNFADKINVPVAFQPQLDFSPYTSAGVDATYDLTGIVNHQGNMHGGHYTADVRGLQDGRWAYCSDDVVKPSTNPSFNLAYILFYVKRRK